MNPADSYRSPKTLSYLSIIGLAVVAFCDFFTTAFGMAQVANPTWTIPLEGGQTAPVWLAFQGLVAVFKLPAYIFTVVVFLMWIHRANKNLSPLGANSVEYSPGWAVGWWFIPFANLVKPFNVVSEIWNKSDPNFAPDTKVLSKTVDTPNLFYFWWFFWIVSNIATNASSRMFDVTDSTMPEFSGHFFIASGILSIIAAFLAIKVVRGITQRQEARFQRLGMTQQFMPPPPPPADFN